MTCEVCQSQWNLDSKVVEQALGKSPIPLWDRYGLGTFGGIIALFLAWGIAIAPVLVGRDAEGVITDPGVIDVFQMQVGDCFDGAEFGSATSPPRSGEVAGISCPEPHDYEVYAIFNLDFPPIPMVRK